MHLSRDDDGFAPCVGLEEPADDHFAVAAGVDVRRIEEIYAEIEGLAQERLAFSLIKRSRLPARERFSRGGAAVGHATEANARNLQTGAAETYVFHGFSCFECSALHGSGSNLWADASLGHVYSP